MASKEEMAVFNSYVYNHYQNGKETNYFLSTDRINAVAVLPLNKVRTLISKFTFRFVFCPVKLEVSPVTGAKFDSAAGMPRWNHLFSQGFSCSTSIATRWYTHSNATVSKRRGHQWGVGSLRNIIRPNWTCPLESSWPCSKMGYATTFSDDSDFIGFLRPQRFGYKPVDHRQGGWLRWRLSNITWRWCDAQSNFNLLTSMQTSLISSRAILVAHRV